MKENIITGFAAVLLLVSCDKNRMILNTLSYYNNSMEGKGYHFGDQLKIPKDVTDNAESISISFEDKETSDMSIDPGFYTLGDNEITFNIKTKDGKALTQDATINVFAKKTEQNISYQVIVEYPHNPKNFVQGFQLEGNTVYESDGEKGSSQMIKYILGTTVPIASTKQSRKDFSEGCTIVGDKVYQLTWQSKKGYIYDKNSLKLLSEFAYPNLLGEGWGLTYDGKKLIASDGSKFLYFLDPENPSELIGRIAVAGSAQKYDQLNELEYHKGFVYANVWQKPFILKINPVTGEVVGKFDFTKIADENGEGENDVLNGIAFKGDHMLITGKNWPKIYQIAIKE
ncbi:glutamine cyclotransferase [Chryseobacterium defluvii]|uniref:Glutamine cyclotransferase n=1 Tax=Chryseobacterium defluvii TaxID=160396 RepID=A0A840KA74_9FLAO|nr:glutaminyl-peptide cyclotransferase [Chryseobacterium defluvii]MBB4804907.1 glutamine cyclotransferase [Chryseobacterium defluvii]